MWPPSDTVTFKMSATVIEKMENMRSLLERAVDYLRVKERYASAKTFAKKRPFAAIAIGVALTTSFLPIVGFVSVVATALIVGIITLFIIEGAAILMAIMVLVFALFSSVAFSLFIVIFLISMFVAGRFMWRFTAPLRTKVANRFAARNGFLATSEASEPQEKGMIETGSTSFESYTSKLVQKLTGSEQSKPNTVSAIGCEDEKDPFEGRSPPDLGYDASQMCDQETY